MVSSVGVFGAEMSGAMAGLCGLAVGCLLPTMAGAEGAVRDIACQGTAVCDAGGACAARASELGFSLSPVDLGEQGEGRYRIAYDGVDAEAILRPDMSLIWTEGGDDLQVLTFLDATRALYVQRSGPGSEGHSTVTFLTCGEAF